jgi:hypothetical protein
MTRYLWRPKHPLAPPGGTLPRGRVVLYEKLGPGAHPCTFCGKVLSWVGKPLLNVCHLDLDKDNDAPGNLAAACRSCSVRHGHDEKFGSASYVEKGSHRILTARRTCESCKREFDARLANVNNGKGRFCSRGCANDGQRREFITSRYRYVTVKAHPLKPGGGKLPAHRVALYDKIGPGPHACHWCETGISWDVRPSVEGCIDTDHLDGDRYNNDPANLVPSCHRCNITRRHADHPPTSM